MSIVTLARIKSVIGVVLQNVRLERPVLSRSQTGWRSRFSSRNHVKINQVWFIAGGMGVKFSLRDIFSVASRHQHSIPMGPKIYYIEESGTDGKDLACR